jgi:hypothetical protein
MNQDHPELLLSVRWWKPEGSKNAARQVLLKLVGETASGEGQGLTCPEASSNARLPVESGALGSRGGAVP